jgi:hypothetical protein
VRLAGCGFYARKIVLDLTKEMSILNPEKKRGRKRWRLDNWSFPTIPVHLVEDLNHGTIITDPTSELVKLVRDALDVDSRASFLRWLERANATRRMNKYKKGQWQQFIVRALDERGDPITDYNMQLFAVPDDPKTRVDAFDKNVSVYSGDPSLRCFMVDLQDFTATKTLWLSIMASVGSEYVEYRGYQADVAEDAPSNRPITSRQTWDAKLDLSGFMGVRDSQAFLAPFTTTLVELYLDREPKKEGSLVRLSKD